MSGERYRPTWASSLYFSGITHELTIKVKIGITKALMISTLLKIERFRFDHEKNKLLIFNKTDHHSITEILLKSDIKRHEPINLRIKLTPLI